MLCWLSLPDLTSVSIIWGTIQLSSPSSTKEGEPAAGDRGGQINSQAVGVALPCSRDLVAFKDLHTLQSWVGDRQGCRTHHRPSAALGGFPQVSAKPL